MSSLDCNLPAETGHEAPPGASAYLPLALGLVHDFNSALTLVLGQLALLEDEGPFSPEQHERLLALRQAVEYAAALPGHLLALARGSAADKRRVEMRALVLGLEGLLRGRMALGTRLVYRLAEGPAWVDGDPQQLTRVLLNLVYNALEAMPRGEPFLGLEIGTREGAEKTVRLTVQDTGPGVAPEVLPRLFEPLVSTRGERGGSGLGLFIVAQLVREHGGSITCDSRPGQGARFEVVLPAVAPSAAARLPSGPLILVIEGDPDVRRLACTILELARCSPRGLATLEDACAAAAVAAGQARAVVIDHAASCHDAGQLARLLALTPDAGVVITVPDRTAGAPIDAARLRAVLPKPYSAADLVAAVRAALAAPLRG